MNYTKLNELAAKAMGWRLGNMPLKGGPAENPCWTDGIHYWPVGTYTPHSDMDYALVLMEHVVNPRMWTLYVESRHGKIRDYQCIVGMRNEIYIEAHAKTAPLAMTLCALRASGVSESELTEAMKEAA